MLRFLALLLVAIAVLVFSQDAKYSKAVQIDAAALAEFKRQELVGLAVVVIDDGKIAWKKGYGWADREKHVPIDPAKTQFRWASISKPVTAVAALQLAENGLLDLDADIRQYVPEFPDKGEKITARQLLCHQGGIVHYSNGKVLETKKTYTDPHPFADVVVALDKFKDSPLVNKPGTKYSYTTHGYILLSAVVERAGKQRFADQVHQRIAVLLGMKDFRPDYHWENIPHRASGYMRKDKERRPADQDHDVSWKLGGGGFTSPATNLARFGIGLMQHKLVSPATEKEMWTINKPSDPQGSRPYGYGFFVIERQSTRLIGHDGSQEKCKTALLFNPTTKKGIALMTNSEWADAMKIAMTLMDVVK